MESSEKLKNVFFNTSEGNSIKEAKVI